MRRAGNPICGAMRICFVRYSHFARMNFRAFPGNSAAGSLWTDRGRRLRIDARNHAPPESP